jgi:hypothetical protein
MLAPTAPIGGRVQVIAILLTKSGGDSAKYLLGSRWATILKGALWGGKIGPASSVLEI